MNNQILKVLLFLGIFIFLFGVFVKLNAPLVEWDGAYLSTAEAIVQGGKLTSPHPDPPLYVLFLAHWFTLFGQSASIARLANAGALLLTGYVVYQTAKSLGNRKSGMLAAAVYLLNPVVIQGSTLMDTGDTSLLPLGFAFFMLVVIRSYQGKLSRLNIFLMALAIAFCFWLKITSALALAVSVFSYYIFLKCLNVNTNEEKKIILGTVLGIIIFYLSWVSISLIFMDKSTCLAILLRPLSAFSEKVILESFSLRIAEFFLHTLRIIFWFSPFLILLLLCIPRLTKEKAYGEELQYLRFLVWVSLFYFVGYLFIGGASWGFPRYYAAVLPFFAVLIGVFVKPLIKEFTRKQTFVFLVLIIVLCLIYIFVLDDPLLLLNLGLKKAILFDHMGIFAIKFAVQVLFYFFLPVLIVILLGKTFLSKNFIDRVIIFLFAGIIISNVSLDIKQAKSVYITSYEYGAQGKNEVVAFVLRQIDKGDIVLATPQFLYEFYHKRVPFHPWRVWLSTESVLKELRKSKPKVFILGLTTHTVGQLRDIPNHPQIKSILNKEYQLYKIGTYSVWIKKARDK